MIFLLILLHFGWKLCFVSIFPNLFPIAAVFGMMGYCKYNLDVSNALVAAIILGIVVDDIAH